MRGSAPASRRASRLGSECESEVIARAACATTVGSPLVRVRVGVGVRIRANPYPDPDPDPDPDPNPKRNPNPNPHPNPNLPSMAARGWMVMRSMSE